MTLTHKQILSKVTKAPFIIKENGLEEYKHGKGMFYSEYGDGNNYTSSEDNDSDWEKRFSEEDESSVSNTGQLPLEDNYYYYCHFINS